MLIDTQTLSEPADPFARIFAPGQLSIGLVLPLTEQRAEDTSVKKQLELATLADRLGFSALWVRDVPLNSPDYPDPQGHLDPWVFLGALSARTRRIVLGSAAIAAPVRHPLHIAKGALSVDAASGGRFILGLGSGDRMPEFAAFGRDPEQRGDIFRTVWARVAEGLAEPPKVTPDIADPAAPPFELRPRPSGGAIPMIAIGSSQQTLGWIARNAGAWVTYYRPPDVQRQRIALWHDAVARRDGGAFRGLGTSFQLELAENREAPPEQLPLGLRSGSRHLVRELLDLRAMGIHHVLFNLNGTGRPIAEILSELSEEVFPEIAMSNNGAPDQHEKD